MQADDFLESIQQLVLANKLNSTYKLALIMAVTNCALEVPCAGGVCEIPYTALAREFLRIYWPQRLPYEPDRGSGASPKGVLRQSTNPGNIVILSLIEEFEHAAGLPGHRRMTFQQAVRLPGFPKLVRECTERVVRKNPLSYLEGFEFLFKKDEPRRQIVLDFSIAQLLRRFHPLILELVQSRWEAKLRAIPANAALLSEGADGSLRDFLFYPERSETLAGIKKILTQAVPEAPRRCFYCGKPLKPGFHADHFLPYSRFAHTRTLNFVFACGHCNCSKSDHLASWSHVEHWIDRNETHAKAIFEASADLVDPGLDVVPGMACQQYAHAGRRQEALWSRAAEALEPHDPSVSEHIVLALSEHLGRMHALSASLPQAFA